MGPAGRYGRGDGMDPRMVEAHLYDDPSYSGHIGHSLHNPAHEMHMMHAMPGGPGGGPGGPSPGAQAQAGWGGGASGGMPRKVFVPFLPFGGSFTLFTCVCLRIVEMHNAGAEIYFSAVGCRFCLMHTPFLALLFQGDAVECNSLTFGGRVKQWPLDRYLWYPDEVCKVKQLLLLGSQSRTKEEVMKQGGQ
jgi:hypothetical protein